MREHRGSYKREEWLYRKHGYGRRVERQKNIGLGKSPVVEKLLGLAGVPASGRMLELGSGDGNGTVHLAKWNYDITGVEVSPTAVDMAQKRLKDTDTLNAQVLCIDATSLDGLDDASFDLAIDSGCLHCVVDSGDRRDVLSSVLRVLKPGGGFVGVSQVQPFVKSIDSERTKRHGEIIFTALEADPQNWGPSRIIRPVNKLLDEFVSAGLVVVWHEHKHFNNDWFCYHVHYHTMKLAS